MPNSIGYAKNLHAHKRKQQIQKMERLVMGLPLWRTEEHMDEMDVDNYIEHLKEKLVDDPKVANVLLKWMELKKKYAKNTGEDITLAELERDD